MTTAIVLMGLKRQTSVQNGNNRSTWIDSNDTLWLQCTCSSNIFYDQSYFELKATNFYILTGKRIATKEFCQVRHVVHKHELDELTLTRTLIG